MVHEWARATEGTGTAVRVVLLDYMKAFDMIDHQILVSKILSLSIPPRVACWICDFLLNRHQRVKLAKDCYSEWGQVPSGVDPPGHKSRSLALLSHDQRPSPIQCQVLEICK